MQVGYIYCWNQTVRVRACAYLYYVIVLPRHKQPLYIFYYFYSCISVYRSHSKMSQFSFIPNSHLCCACACVCVFVLCNCTATA